MRAANDGVSLRQAALIAGFAYLLNPVSYAEFVLSPRLIVAGHVEQTIANIATHPTSFVAIIFCYFINFIEDVIIAWALYVLLAPVNRFLSLLTAWLRLVYTAMGIFGLLNLVNVYRLVSTPEYLKLFGLAPLRAQVDLMLHAFRYDWTFALIVFGIHLCLLGYLLYRSGYAGISSKIVGILLVIAGIGWIVNELQPYLYPHAPLGWIFLTSLAELILMLWLLIAGWRLRDPSSISSSAVGDSRAIHGGARRGAATSCSRAPPR